MDTIKRLFAVILALWLAVSPAVTTVYADDTVKDAFDIMNDNFEVELASDMILPDPTAMSDDGDGTEYEEPEEESSESTDENSEEPAQEETKEDTEEKAEEERLIPGAPRYYEDGSIVNKVPLIYQTDYPEIPYGGGSVATSGCTITDMAMIAGYLRGMTVSVPDLASRFRNMDGSHIQRMLAIAYIYGLKVTQVYSVSDVAFAAKQGKVAVMLMGEQSQFTKTQHTIVVYGISADGKLYIHDSNANNYHNSFLKPGFMNGFEIDDLTLGFSGAWVFEPYVAERVPEDSPYKGVELTDEEKTLIAKLIWREARGESYEGQQAVAEVVLNRYISGRFGKSIRGIIYAEGQFISAHLLNETTADEIQYYVLERALQGYNVLPTDVLFYARTAVNKNVYRQIGKHVFCKAY